MYSYGPPHMTKQKQDGQLEHTYSSYVRIRDAALKTCQMRWMIGRSSQRGSGISVLAARHDDDDDDDEIIKYFYLTNVILTDTTTPGQSGPESNGNEGVLHIPQSSRDVVSTSVGLVSYLGHSFFEGVLPSSDVQSGYSPTPVNWAKNVH